jgi:hypothetical protein
MILSVRKVYKLIIYKNKKMGPKKQIICAADAIANILKFVEEDDDGSELDYEELYDEEQLGGIDLEIEGLFILACIILKYLALALLHVVFI